MVHCLCLYFLTPGCWSLLVKANFWLALPHLEHHRREVEWRPQHMRWGLDRMVLQSEPGCLSEPALCTLQLRGQSEPCPITHRARSSPPGKSPLAELSKCFPRYQPSPKPSSSSTSSILSPRLRFSSSTLRAWKSSRATDGSGHRLSKWSCFRGEGLGWHSHWEASGSEQAEGGAYV